MRRRACGPLVSLLSLGLVLGLSEVAARVFWPEQLQDRCVLRDPVLGLRFQLRIGMLQLLEQFALLGHV